MLMADRLRAEWQLAEPLRSEVVYLPWLSNWAQWFDFPLIHSDR
jgi:hypothetical protein